MHVDDAAIIERYLRGERDAVALVDRWLALAAGPFRRRLGFEWDDALQEARLEAFRQLSAGRFRGESRLKTYLGRIACLTCIDAVRRVRRRPPLETDDGAASVASGEPSPLDLALRGDTRRSLLALFEATSPECRELWRMIHQGLSYREMAGRLGVAEGTLRVRVHRCRKHAADVLAAGAGGRGADIDGGDAKRMGTDGLS